MELEEKNLLKTTEIAPAASAENEVKVEAAPAKKVSQEAPQMNPQTEKKVRAPYMSNQYMVVSTANYFWTTVLFCIPVLGWFACIITALGGSRYRNRIHYARAYLIFLLLQLVLLGGIGLLAAWLGAEMVEEWLQLLQANGIAALTDFTKLDEWVKSVEAIPEVQNVLVEMNQSVFGQ